MGIQEEAEGPVLFPQTVPGVQESLGEGQDVPPSSALSFEGQFPSSGFVSPSVTTPVMSFKVGGSDDVCTHLSEDTFLSCRSF